MIAYLRGTLLAKKPQYAVVETGNVGYEVHVPLSTYYELGEVGTEVALYIHTQLSVRQSSVALYGFRTRAEHGFFQKLISVTGVGPTLGLKILSGMPVAELIELIRKGDLSMLVRIPSLGKRNAERIIVELRDKLASLSTTATTHETPQRDTLSEDVISALVNLGYSRKVAESAAEKSGEDSTGSKSLDQALKQALGRLLK